MRTSHRRIEVVIVSHNTREPLRRCLHSLRWADPDDWLETWVVDNASDDGSAAMVREEFPEVRLVALPYNIGFARAMNLILNQIRTDWVMWLNPDAELTPGAVETMVETFQCHPRAGIVAPRLINPDGSLQSSLRRRSFYRPLHFLLRASALGQHVPVLRGAQEAERYDDWDHSSDETIDFANGACLLHPVHLVHALGGLDERFTIYSEDMDFCERVRQAGYEIRYAHAARVRHAGGASTRRAPIVLRLHLVHAEWQFVTKHFGALTASVQRISVLLEAGRLVLGSLRRPRETARRLRLGQALAGWAIHPAVPPLPGAPPPTVAPLLGIGPDCWPSSCTSPARARLDSP